MSLLLAAVAVRLWALPCGISAGFRGIATRRGGSAAPGRRWAGWRFVGLLRVRPDSRRGGRVRGLAGAVPMTRWAAALGVSALVTVPAGPLIGAAVGLLVHTAASISAIELAASRIDRDRAAATVAVRALAREVRAGAPPIGAVRSIATAHPGAGPWLAELQLAMTTHRGGAPDRMGAPPGWGTGSVTGTSGVGDLADRLLAGWRLAARHGVAWAGLLDPLSEDLLREDAAARGRSAQSAGPRLSGYLLAALPAFGLLLGSAMGAHPVAVLFGTGLGQLLLLVGVTLTCAGLRWTTHLVRPAE